MHEKDDELSSRKLSDVFLGKLVPCISEEDPPLGRSDYPDIIASYSSQPTCGDSDVDPQVFLQYREKVAEIIREFDTRYRSVTPLEPDSITITFPDPDEFQPRLYDEPIDRLKG